MRKSTLLKTLRNVVGFVIAFFLMRYVVNSSGIDVREVLRTVDRRFLVAAFCCYGVGFFMAAIRWFLLLRHIQVALSLLVVIRLALIGQFFNLFVPGGVGGDLIKMFYLKRESGSKFPEAVLTVLLDRILGLMGLLMLALLAIGFNLSILEDSSRQMQAILTVVGLAGVAGLLGTLVFIAWPILGRFSKTGEALMGRLPGGVSMIVTRLIQAFSLLRSSPGKVLLLLGIAMANHLCATLGIVCIGMGVGGVQQVSFQSFLLATQLSNLVAAIPLTPGGLGGRDLALSFLLGAGGADPVAKGAVPLVVTSLLIAWSALGGLALLWEKRVGPGEEGGDKKSSS